MRHSSARRLSPAVLPALLVLVLAGCSGEERATPEPSPTPIAHLDSETMQVPRIEFCGLVPSSAVREALSGESSSEAAYGNGDVVPLPGVGKDVVHEIGCSWTGEAGVTARAWVFARPVDAAFARTVVATGRRSPDCRAVPGPAYGRPSSTQVCRQAGGEERVRHSGLFGQTWLTCELVATGGSLSDAQLRSRADRWCVEVVTAMDTAR